MSKKKMVKIPTVSVCIVTYNHERYIRDCLMSVLAQCEDVSLEILIGDDLSQDKTGNIIQSLANKYPSLIRYFRYTERKGPSGNYQFLIREACGKYIAHLDGDDFWLPGKLRKQLALLEKNPDLVAVFSNAIVVDENIALKGAFNRTIPETFDLGFLLRRGNFICHSSLIYQAKAKESVLSISTPFLDYQIHTELAQQGHLGYINSTLVGYRVASATSMSVLQAEHVQDLYWQTLLSIQNSPQINKDLGSAIAYFLFISSWNLFKKNQISKISTLWKKVLTNLPISKTVFLFLLFIFLCNHLKFKTANFFAKKLLRRPLKTYFIR